MNVRNEIRPVGASGSAYDQLFPVIRATLEAGISVLLLGPPGVGKSSMAVELARSMKKKLIDIRLAQKDPAELGGVYFPDRETRTLELFPPSWVKRACEEPCLVFLDEFNAAVTKLHQAAAYQIVLEKRIGDFEFHPGTVVLAAGNREEDNAIVTPLSSALCNRFAHFEMRPDTDAWLEWAAANGIDENIMAFVRTYGDEVLFTISDEHSFPTPRSWAMASRVLAHVEPGDAKRALAACIGVPMADKFHKYMILYRRVDAAGIISGKAKADFVKNSEPSFVYAAIFAVAGYLARAAVPDAHLENIVSFITSPGVEPEYQILFLRQLRHRAQGLFDRLKVLSSFRKLAGDLVSLRTSLYLS